ncbi:hypothetical protein [Paracoccus sp. ME4]|uniref:hypothetical protein n=1 Tax=Paracoccus sp. ME4 TaxID=3138066 RepID=UPI00398AC56A
MSSGLDSDDGKIHRLNLPLPKRSTSVDTDFDQGGGLNPNLKGPILPSMEPASKDYVDLKIEASLAKVEARLSVMPTTGTMLMTAFTSSVAIVGLILAILSFGGDRFDSGVGMADRLEERVQTSNPQSGGEASQTEIIRRLDALLAAPPTPSAPAPGTPTE